MTLKTLMLAGPTRANELFARIAETSGGAVKTREKLFAELKAELELHTSLEEQHLFPVLTQQGAAFKAIADRLAAEHVVVHELLERLVEALNTLATEPSETRFTDARDIYHALERVLLSHLGWEEEAMGDALGYFEIM